MNDTCTWTLDDSMDGDVWETGCGETFQFTDGGPIDNNFVFCYKCGKRIDPGKYSDCGSVGEEGKCAKCGGSGEIEIGRAMDHALTAPCVDCRGTGMIG